MLKIMSGKRISLPKRAAWEPSRLLQTWLVAEWILSWGATLRTLRRLEEFEIWAGFMLLAPSVMKQEGLMISFGEGPAVKVMPDRPNFSFQPKTTSSGYLAETDSPI